MSAPEFVRETEIELNRTYVVEFSANLDGDLEFLMGAGWATAVANVLGLPETLREAESQGWEVTGWPGGTGPHGSRLVAMTYRGMW